MKRMIFGFQGSSGSGRSEMAKSRRITLTPPRLAYLQWLEKRVDELSGLTSEKTLNRLVRVVVDAAGGRPWLEPEKQGTP